MILRNVLSQFFIVKFIIGFENCTWMERSSRNCYSPQEMEILGSIYFLKQYFSENSLRVTCTWTIRQWSWIAYQVRLRWSQTKLFLHGKLIPFLVSTLFLSQSCFIATGQVSETLYRRHLRPHLSNLINDYFVHTF